MQSKAMHAMCVVSGIQTVMAGAAPIHMQGVVALPSMAHYPSMRCRERHTCWNANWAFD